MESILGQELLAELNRMALKPFLFLLKNAPVVARPFFILNDRVFQSFVSTFNILLMRISQFLFSRLISGYPLWIQIQFLSNK